MTPSQQADRPTEGKRRRTMQPRPKAKSKLSAKRQRAVVYWTATHRGALTRIARECGVSVQMVRFVLRGERGSRDKRVERRLKAAGAELE
jgi:hypothetical protein